MTSGRAVIAGHEVTFPPAHRVAFTTPDGGIGAPVVAVSMSFPMSLADLVALVWWVCNDMPLAELTAGGDAEVHATLMELLLTFGATSTIIDIHDVIETVDKAGPAHPDHAFLRDVRALVNRLYAPCTPTTPPRRRAPRKALATTAP